MPKDTTEDRHAGAGTRIEGVLTGRIVSPGAAGMVVGYERDGAACVAEARCLGATGTLPAGTAVALMFEGGDPDRPLVLGKMEDTDGPAAPLALDGDSEGVRLSHPRRLRLVCGKAAITLSADGRVEIVGDHVTSLARGTNRMGGASVKIN